jgi:hypothetical protein
MGRINDEEMKKIESIPAREKTLLATIQTPKTRTDSNLTRETRKSRVTRKIQIVILNALTYRPVTVCMRQRNTGYGESSPDNTEILDFPS